jgi:hypothetical protein
VDTDPVGGHPGANPCCDTPRHTVIATGHEWSSVDDLVALEPLADGNVVYNFHFYDPFTFTHQSATWGDPAWSHISGVPYPSSPEAVQPMLASVADERARESVIAYGRQRWDTGKLEARLLRAANWAMRHKPDLQRIWRLRCSRAAGGSHRLAAGRA